MNRIILAFRAFFRILLDPSLAEQVQQVLDHEAIPAVEQPAPPEPQTKPAKPAAVRNEALTLLAALQREGRLVDFMKEPITGYSDAQIGAAVRDIHRDCGALLDRFFGLQPVEAAVEGSELEIPEDFDPARIRLVGNVTGQPPFRGQLCHHGWEATRCELPEWTGSERSLYVIAPAEVELKS